MLTGCEKDIKTWKMHMICVFDLKYLEIVMVETKFKFMIMGTVYHLDYPRIHLSQMAHQYGCSHSCQLVRFKFNLNCC